MHNQKPLIFENKNPKKAVILIHGRGGDSEEMMAFAKHHLSDTNAKFIALQADNNEWYPYPFTMPRKDNEPNLSAALEAVDRAVKNSGFSKDKIIILGFSQGACLAAEYAARNPGKYGGIIVFSGGLIGEEIRGPEDKMEGTRVVFSCSLNDPYIPADRAKESAMLFEKSGAQVIEYIYPGNTHTIMPKELEFAKSLIES